MVDILTRAAYFICIILLGFFLRSIGMLKREDFIPLSKICLRVTLTASIVISFSGRTIDPSMFLLTLIGLGFGVLLMLAISCFTRKSDEMTKAFHVLNIAGCNIGTFALPFAVSFLGPLSVMCISIFDMGNSMVCLGGAYGIACSIREGNRKLDFRPVFKAVSHSVAFITYLIMTVLCLLHISLPKQAIEFAQIIANANAFLAMFMIGVGFHLSAEKSHIASLLRILGTRYALGITLAVLSYTLLPFPIEYRQALVIVFLAPIASAAPGFTADLGGDYGLASAINSISIIISITLIITALTFII